jgi:hypothetical protein
VSPESPYSRATLMDLVHHLPDVPGIDMLVNLPEDEQVLDMRVAELSPKAGDAIHGRPERGVLCSTDRRLLFFLRPAAVELDRELQVATGYLVESLLLDQPLDRERAARFFPKKPREVLALRARMAKLFFPDLQPVLSLPLAGLAAFMYYQGPAKLACLDLEVDLRAEGQELRAAISQNPQLRLTLGPRFVSKPYPKPDPNLPLVGTCEVAELVRLVDQLRHAQSEIDYERLPNKLFRAPWAIVQLSFSPRAKAEVLYRGERLSGSVGVEHGELTLPHKLLGRDVLFNVGEVDQVSWDATAQILVIKGAGMHHRWKVEAPDPEFHWLRSYLEELVEVKQLVWELPGRAGMAPDAKQDPVGGLLCYHLETCNDPAVILPARISQEQVEEFMDEFGQLLPAEEVPQGLVLLVESAPRQEGVLFTDRALYARRIGQPGARISYARVESEVQVKKGLVSTQLSLGPIQLGLGKLGKETVRNLFQVLKDLPKLAR